MRWRTCESDDFRAAEQILDLLERAGIAERELYIVEGRFVVRVAAAGPGLRIPFGRQGRNRAARESRPKSPRRKMPASSNDAQRSLNRPP